MAAVIGSVPDVVSGTGARARVGVGTVDPAALALLKQLDPLAVMLTLFGCVLLHGERMSHTTLGLGLLTFLISSPILARSPRHSAVTRIGWWATFSRILIEWTKVVAILLFLGFVFNVGSPFSRVVALSWLCATPIALLLV
ncbi:MAG: hypothetical protein ACRD3Q_19810, partial [Terriglobales bacterium]